MRIGRGVSWVAGMAYLFVLCGAAAAQEVEEPAPKKQLPPTFAVPLDFEKLGPMILQQGTAAGGIAVPQGAWKVGVAAEVIRPSEYWLGLQCGVLSPALRAQLGLKDNEGVLVEAVVEKTPAAQAGIQQYDVLIGAGDRKLTKVQDLIDAVDAVKEEKIDLELIRRGKKKQVEATPVKRPEGAVPGGATVLELQKLQELMQNAQPGKDGQSSMKLQFFHPGAVFGDPNKKVPALPGNVKISIHRHGDGPAKIEVTRRDETWKIDENQLDQLPDDLRPHIQRMLGRAVGLRMAVPMPKGQVAPTPFPRPPHFDGNRLQKQLEELQRRMEQIQQSVEELREKSAADSDAP